MVEVAHIHDGSKVLVQFHNGRQEVRRVDAIYNTVSGTKLRVSAEAKMETISLEQVMKIYDGRLRQAD